MAIGRAKHVLRTAMAERRAAVATDSRAAIAGSVSEHVLGLPVFSNARVVALYAALPHEIPLDAVAEVVLEGGRVLALPRMQDDRLHFARVEDWRALERGRFGICEPPAAAPEVALARGDLILLPGVAFDAQGGRLGRGGGHYDRVLAALGSAPPCCVGVGFAFQLVSQVPMDIHDQRVDAFVCERGVTPCGPRDRRVDPS